MGVTINGNSIVISDATIEIINGANPESGVSYIIITPSGGVGELPFMEQGLPGQPTLFTSITVEQLPDGDALPATNPEQTLVDPGGAGLPAKYALKFYVNAGAEGPTGSPSFAGASDLAATPVLGVATDKFTLLYRASDSKFVPTAQKVGDMWVSNTITATTFNAVSPRLLHSISIPALGFDYRPIPFAQTIVTGSVDTRVDLHAYLNTVGSGDQVGYAKGLIGANVAGIQTVMLPGPPAGSTVPGAYGKVAAGAGATVHLRAEQKAASALSWSTPASPDTTFSVLVQALI